MALMNHNSAVEKKASTSFEPVDPMSSTLILSPLWCGKCKVILEFTKRETYGQREMYLTCNICSSTASEESYFPIIAQES